MDRKKRIRLLFTDENPVNIRSIPERRCMYAHAGVFFLFHNLWIILEKSIKIIKNNIEQYETLVHNKGEQVIFRDYIIRGDELEEKFVIPNPAVSRSSRWNLALHGWKRRGEYHDPAAHGKKSRADKLRYLHSCRHLCRARG